MVAERICRIPRSDLKTIRITCAKCHRTTETNIEDASALFYDGQCRLCGERLFEGRSRDRDPFNELTGALARFDELQSKFSIEFVIPNDGDDQA